MYECPNCGGNLKYDISVQQLVCASCDTQFDPYEVSKENDAEESTSYDVTVFTCPQCGGEIYSTDNTAAGFCSFCGASTILSSRISRERRPSYIIPFAKTKEECKAAYAKMMRRALFAPKELKDEKHINGFRGIYMPYWLYYLTYIGPFELHGTKKYRRGDYIITDHYNLSGNIDARYKGLSYDASSSFADNISERIAPFDVKNMKSFTPSMLSGFYADTADVESGVYQEDAERVTLKETGNFVRKHPKIKSYSLSETDPTLAHKLHQHSEAADTAMFPVWFLSYRNGDRVAYATVNGQTGKVAADLPVDVKKYLLGSLILAIPIYCLLNLFLTMKPATALVVVALIALLALILHAVEMKQIVERDANLDDKGFWSGRQDQSEAAATAEWVKKTQEKKQKKKEKKEKGGVGSVIISVIIFYVVAVPFIIFMLSYQAATISVVLLIGAIVASVFSMSYYKRIEAKQGLPGFIGALSAVALGVIILILHPVSDLYYYGGEIAGLIAVFFTLLDLIRYYNVLATRKLPQFDYRGGDDLA